jgi:hypothetical protein
MLAVVIVSLLSACGARTGLGDDDAGAPGVDARAPMGDAGRPARDGGRPMPRLDAGLPPPVDAGMRRLVDSIDPSFAYRESDDMLGVVYLDVIDDAGNGTIYFQRLRKAPLALTGERVEIATGAVAHPRLTRFFDRWLITYRASGPAGSALELVSLRDVDRSASTDGTLSTSICGGTTIFTVPDGRFMQVLGDPEGGTHVVSFGPGMRTSDEILDLQLDRCEVFAASDGARIGLLYTRAPSAPGEQYEVRFAMVTFGATIVPRSHVPIAVSDVPISAAWLGHDGSRWIVGFNDLPPQVTFVSLTDVGGELIMDYVGSSGRLPDDAILPIGHQRGEQLAALFVERSATSAGYWSYRTSARNRMVGSLNAAITAVTGAIILHDPMEPIWAASGDGTLSGSTRRESFLFVIEDTAEGTRHLQVSPD